MPVDLNGESRTLLPVKLTVVVKLVVNILVNILANILVNILVSIEAVHVPLPPRPFVPTQPQTPYHGTTDLRLDTSLALRPSGLKTTQRVRFWIH